MNTRLFYLLLAFLSVGSMEVDAATINAINSSAWNLEITWAGGVVPIAGDDVVIEGSNVTITTGTITCQSINITSNPGVFLGANGTTGVLNVNSGVTLNISGNLSLTSHSDATSTLPLNSEIIIANGATTVVTGNVVTGYTSFADSPYITLGGTLTVNGLLDISSGFGTIYMNNNAAYY
jgi:hypothetical protein